MSKKIILSILGLAALIIPVILLITLSDQAESEPNVNSEQRQINPTNVQNVVDKAPAAPAPVSLPSPTVSPSPTPSPDPSPTSSISPSPSTQPATEQEGSTGI